MVCVCLSQDCIPGSSSRSMRSCPLILTHPLQDFIVTTHSVMSKKKASELFLSTVMSPYILSEGWLWGPKAKQNLKDLSITTHTHNTINFSPVLHCQSFQFCSPGRKKKWPNMSLGLRSGSRQLCLVLSIQLWLSEQSQNSCF